MSSAEHDFLGLDNGGGGRSSSKKPAMERKKSFREISRMSPDVIKSVIATSTAAVGIKRKAGPLPVLSSTSGSKVETATAAAAVAPLTIFYNGAVEVFDLPQQKAENILKLVEADKVGDVVDASKDQLDDEQLLVNHNGDLPMARRISVKRLLGKRKER